MMDNDQNRVRMIEQEEIVHKYAFELRDTVGGIRRMTESGTGRRCYELLNQCAMELAGLTRAQCDPGEQTRSLHDPSW